MKQQWLTIYQDLKEKGFESSPRGLKIKELEDYIFTGDPYNRFANFEERKLNIKYIVGEFCWYLRGDLNDIEGISYYSKFWKNIVNENPPFLNSNYGHYIFQLKQFEHCYNILLQDKDSRQATIILADRKNNFEKTKDKICTYSINFRIRNNKLNMSVNMRSNDFILGTQIDYFQFSVIQEMLLKKLQLKYENLEMGKYTHKADSLHIYENKFDLMDKILNNNGENFYPIEFPKIKNAAEVDYILENLANIEYKIRTKNITDLELNSLYLYLEEQQFYFTLRCIDTL